MPVFQYLSGVNDLKHLRDLYKSKLPTSAHGYYILKNYVRWFEFNPTIDYVHIYVYDNWKETGFFIILDRNQLFINTLCVTLIDEEMKSILSILEWNSEYRIVALPEILHPALDIKLKRIHGTNIRTTSLKIYQRDVSSIKKKLSNFTVPDSLLLRALSLADVNIVYEALPSKQESSLELIQSLIRYNTSLGLYTKSTNELVAWCTRCQSGSLNPYVKQEYRRQGLATLLIQIISQKLFHFGEDVRTMISDENLILQFLFDKLDFKYVEEVFDICKKPLRSCCFE